MSRYAIDFSVTELVEIQKEAEHRARNRALASDLDWEVWYKENAEAIRKSESPSAPQLWIWSKIYQRCTDVLRRIQEDLRRGQTETT